MAPAASKVQRIPERVGKSRMRGLPNALTLAGLGLGFLASLAAGRGDGEGALRLLALAALADGLASRAAHGLQHSTALGAELDSLGSLVVWGLAVALLTYTRVWDGLGVAGLFLAGLVVVAGAWRLCRGDAQKGRRSFDGLPLPVAGMVLASLAALGAPALVCAAAALVLVFAQLAPVAFPRLYPSPPWLVPLFASMGAAALGWRPGWILPGLAAALYAVIAPLYVRAPSARA